MWLMAYWTAWLSIPHLKGKIVQLVKERGPAACWQKKLSVHIKTETDESERMEDTACTHESIKAETFICSSSQEDITPPLKIRLLFRSA